MTEVAIIGSGGREHTLATAIAESTEVGTIYCVPGNAGTARVPKTYNISRGLHYANKLLVIGPEEQLIRGLADSVRAEGGLVFGPSAAAAMLEGSKAHATRFMQDAGIPHPPAEIVDELSIAEQYVVARRPSEYVIKADGLAGGKGVILPKTQEQALRTVRNMMSGKLFGTAGETIILQDRYHGPELSAFVVSDGEKWTLLPLIQDHKRLKNGDKGPNTGGTGAYGPVPDSIVSQDQYEKILKIADDTIQATNEKGVPFQGVLFIGIMLARELGGDPVVIEYNVRFGDPETQVLVSLLQKAGVDIFRLLYSSAEGSLEIPTVDFRNLGYAALTVCEMAKGYPRKPQVGEVIHGLNETYDQVTIQHGATALSHGGRRVSTSGGRVLYVTGEGVDIDEAADYAYAAIGRKGVWFDGMHYREDIGHQARRAS